MHDSYFVVVVATHRACMLLSSVQRPPIARYCSGARHTRAIVGIDIF